MLRSQDYHAHISEVHRTPSVLPDVPRYPNAHLAFNKKVVYEEEDQGSHHNPHTGEVIYEENVDVETDQSYPGKNKGRFELQKWKTFKP